MKWTFFILLLFFGTTVNSQGSIKIRQIDSLVQSINRSGHKVEKDSIVQDYPNLGLYIKTYLTVMTDSGYLKKYVNEPHSRRSENGIEKIMTAGNSFYFEGNKLIKVEEFAMEGDRRQDFDWYFYDDKPLYYSLKSEKSESRAYLLLSMAKGILANFHK